MTNEELISKYYDGNMQALYDLYEQNVGFIQSVAAAVAKDYKNYLRFSDTFEDLVQVGSLTFFEKLKAKKYDARKGFITGLRLRGFFSRSFMTHSGRTFLLLTLASVR